MGSNLTGYKYNVINSLGVAMFIMMIANPFCIFDVSFILSCMAVFAIALFYSPINDIFKKLKKNKYKPVSYKYNIVPEKF